MKRFLRWFFRQLGCDIVRHVEMPVSPFAVLDLVVADRVASGRKPVFLQVGANDGVNADPIRHLILRYGLTGLLVEPLPDLFSRLQANYAGHSGLQFEQCAVGEFDGQTSLFRIRSDPQLPTWMQGLASFSRSHISSARFEFKNIEQYVEEVTVPVLTIGSLLRKHGMPEIDLLQVDTEGFDCRIVRSAIGFGLRPAIINYEHIHAAQLEQAECKRVLADNGYDFIDAGIDTLAVRRDSSSRTAKAD